MLQAVWRCLSTAGRLSSQFSLLCGLSPGVASPTAGRHTSKDTPLLVYTLAQIFMHIQPLNLTSRSLATNIYSTTNHQLIHSQAFNQVSTHSWLLEVKRTQISPQLAHAVLWPEYHYQHYFISLQGYYSHIIHSQQVVYSNTHHPNHSHALFPLNMTL